MRLQITNTLATSGVETIQVNAKVNEIYSATSGVTPITVNTGTITFPDRLAPNAPAGMSLAAAKAAGIRRVVFTSSCWAAGVSDRPDKVLTPKDWNQDARNPYAVAKTESERAAWQLAEQLGIAMIAICPGALLGPYDYRVTPSTALIASFISGSAPIYDGGLSDLEIGPVAEVIHSPQHPYTVGLMGAIPAVGDDVVRLAQIDGSMPRLNAIPKGCAFNPRCTKKDDVPGARCTNERPDLLSAGKTHAACWLHAKSQDKVSA